MRVLFAITTIIFIFLAKEGLANTHKKQTSLKKKEYFLGYKHQKEHHESHKALILDHDIDKNIAIRKNNRPLVASYLNKSSINFENSFESKINNVVIRHTRSKHHYISQLLFPYHSFLEQLT
ncbi:hypothetical protein PBAC_21620 [Pedobacter glucosidilyticus]|nr:hypothetical protein [Pedobacter glucosidilyticus]KHJ37698.1 hypothetical protein PBAC_21620 [Pedobacter glucosidilyticus]